MLCLAIPHFGKGRKHFEDYHPLRKEEAKEYIRRLMENLAEVRKHLPPTLPEEEIERRWQEYLKACQDSQT